MRMAGFIKDMEDGILGESIDYDSLNLDTVAIGHSAVDKVLDYLQKGKMVFAMPLALEDTDGSYIGPYTICTDGEWIWPGYYSYYIKTNKVGEIPKDLLDRMAGNNFIVPPVESMTEVEAKDHVLKLLIKNNPSFLKK